MIEIKAKTLYDGKGRGNNATVFIEKGVVREIRYDTKPNESEAVITPAFIDAHSHIGLDRHAEPYTEGETNDGTSLIQPLLDPLNSIYFDDRSFSDAVDWGVLYSCVVPGSGNIIGGKAVAIKNFAKNRKEGFLRYCGYKMALGFNVRLIGSDDEWKGERPNTRMGAYSMLENKFNSVLRKRARAEMERQTKRLESDGRLDKAALIDGEYELALDEEDLAILSLLDGNATAKVHVHKVDDVYYLIDLVKKYNLKVSAEHLCDINDEQVFKDIADAGISIVYGPMGSFDYKVELKNSSYKNAVSLIKSGVKFGLMSDHPVTLSYCLRDQLKYFVTCGLSKVQAISLITYENAQALGLYDLGVVEVNKPASLVVWNKDPFDLSAVPIAVYAEGEKVRG